MAGEWRGKVPIHGGAEYRNLSLRDLHLERHEEALGWLEHLEEVTAEVSNHDGQMWFLNHIFWLVWPAWSKDDIAETHKNGFSPTPGWVRSLPVGIPPPRPARRRRQSHDRESGSSTQLEGRCTSVRPFALHGPADRAAAGVELDFHEAPEMLHVHPLLPIPEGRAARAALCTALRS